MPYILPHPQFLTLYYTSIDSFSALCRNHIKFLFQRSYKITLSLWQDPTALNHRMIFPFSYLAILSCCFCNIKFNSMYLFFIHCFILSLSIGTIEIFTYFFSHLFTCSIYACKPSVNIIVWIKKQNKMKKWKKVIFQIDKIYKIWEEY